MWYVMCIYSTGQKFGNTTEISKKFNSVLILEDIITTISLLKLSIHFTTATLL